MNESSEGEYEVGKFYTAARKFKQLIGRLPDGSTIPGGPYTITQFIVAMGIIFFGWMTRSAGVWGGSFFGDMILLVALAAGVGYLCGLIPATRRTLTGMIDGAIKMSVAPNAGTWRGKALSKQLPGLQAAKKKNGQHTQRTTKIRDKQENNQNGLRIETGVERLLREMQTQQNGSSR